MLSVRGFFSPISNAITPSSNRFYAEYFESDRLPARTTAGVAQLARGGIVEVDLIARRSQALCERNRRSSAGWVLVKRRA
jgi:enamine deaminase RidA (YjgF/YER057c/UK114 family)